MWMIYKFFFLPYYKIILCDDAVLTPLPFCRYPVSCFRRTSSSTICPCRFPFLRFRPCVPDALKLYNHNVSNSFVKFPYNSCFGCMRIIAYVLRFTVWCSFLMYQFGALLLIFLLRLLCFCPLYFHKLVTILSVLLNLSYFSCRL